MARKIARTPKGEPVADLALGVMVDVANQDRRFARENPTYKVVWVQYKGRNLPLHFTDHAVAQAAARSARPYNLVDVPSRIRRGVLSALRRLFS